MSDFADLEIVIRPRTDEKSGYPVVLRLSDHKNDLDQLFPDSRPAFLKIDLDELYNLRGQDARYGARLSELFFQDTEIQKGFDAARSAARAEGSDGLRVRLFLDAGADELHRVRWECLRDGGKLLFTGDTIHFSRYLATSEWQPIGGQSGSPTALIAIANPKNLDQTLDPEDPEKSRKLAPVDVETEKRLAESGLKDARCNVTTLASPPFGTAPATLANILRELGNGYDIFYLVCHGGLVNDFKTDTLTPMLWLEDDDNPVSAAKLVEGIRTMARKPRLIVLASCQSAGTSASSTLGALGPLLARAGVPAVIAMQGNIRMKTVEKFMPEFFRELARDGQVDRAMAAARRAVVGYGDEPEQDDYWMPVLFMRLKSGRIWYQSDKARTARNTLFLDLLSKVVKFPIESALDSQCLAGEVKPADDAWAPLIQEPGQPPFAIGRAFGENSEGRVLAIGHERILTYRDPEGKNRFLEVAMTWLRGENDANVFISAKPTDTLQLFRSKEFNLAALHAEFDRWGYEVEEVTDFSSHAGLKKGGVIVIPNSWGNFTPLEVDAIATFVKDGGGLLALGLGWSWRDYGPLPLHGQNQGPGHQPTIESYPMNVLFQRFGASWTVNIARGPEPGPGFKGFSY
jgi:hypothetical protein